MDYSNTHGLLAGGLAIAENFEEYRVKPFDQEQGYQPETGTQLAEWDSSQRNQKE